MVFHLFFYFVTVKTIYYITIEFEYAKRDSRLAAYGCVVLKRPSNVSMAGPGNITIKSGQTVVTQQLHILQGESHVSRIQTRWLCNSTCRPFMSLFAERSHKRTKKNLKNNNSLHRELEPPLIPFVKWSYSSSDSAPLRDRCMNKMVQSIPF